MQLPKLFAPFKEKLRGWVKDKVADQLTLYLNVLGFGRGGGKNIKTQKPDFWPDSISHKIFTHPTQGTIETNEDIIEAILEYYNLDKETHYKMPSQKKAKKRGRKSSKSTKLEQDEERTKEPYVTTTKENKNKENVPEWKKKLGSPPSKNMGVRQWIEFQKEKWKVQMQEREKKEEPKKRDKN